MPTPSTADKSFAFSHSGAENASRLGSDLKEEENNRRILIVDDEVSIRDMFADHLCQKYECITASSADEALAQLTAHPYALVISDMLMPGRNGVELLREITSRFPDTLVIIVSGIDRSQRVRDTLQVGAFDYLIKPCELDVLALSVERAFEHRALSQQAKRYKADLERQNVELAARKAELERLQAQIIHNEKMASLGQVAAGVAHELNNPAGFVLGNMDILTEYASGLGKLLTAYEQIELPSEGRARIDRIKAETHCDDFTTELASIIADCREGAERIRGVVQNLRLFSRLDEADVKLIDIHEGIDSTIRILSRYFSGGQIGLLRNYGELPAVKCYAGQLNQVWMNLLANAAQATGEKGKVRIWTWLEDQSVVVSISDTGCGIAKEHMDRIFDPFYTTKPVGEGTGLGLSISYGIIERHGGSISVESKVGEGATFTVRIPIDAKLEVGETEESNPHQSKS